MQEKFKILGVDTALRCTGYGVLEVDGSKLKALDYGVIKTQAKKPVSECLRRLGGGIKDLIQAYKPDVAAIEGVFFYRNAKTAMLLGMARGTVVSHLAEANIPAYEYSPKKAKLAVTGYGGASKEQLALVIVGLLKLKADIPLDASDALSLAFCHYQTFSTTHEVLLPKKI